MCELLMADWMVYLKAAKAELANQESKIVILNDQLTDQEDQLVVLGQHAERHMVQRDQLVALRDQLAALMCRLAKQHAAVLRLKSANQHTIDQILAQVKERHATLKSQIAALKDRMQRPSTAEK
jgi:hypothetical protein